MLPAYEFWKVQNTGYSAGVSWFDAGGTQMNLTRFPSEAAARAFVRDAHWGGKGVKWRLVHVRIERTDKQCVTTETFFPLRPRRRRSPA